MLSILFNWLYITVTVFCLGYGFSRLSSRLLSYSLKGIDSILIAGIIITTVYAQCFSLITGVGLTANIILILACLVISILLWKPMTGSVRRAWISCSLTKKIVIACLILLWAYFTSRGYMHYDSDLYHAQSIRWIEEYGIVPGQGNLHERFAYNSSSFAFSALYSMKFLLGRSLHTISGYFALLLSITSVNVMKSWKRKKLILSDYVRVAAIYYLTTITEEVVAPASDYSIMCMIFFIVIKWMDCLAAEASSAVPEHTSAKTTCRRAAAGNPAAEISAQIAPYALLCVAGVYAMTLKLTAGLILLLLIKPAYLLLKNKRWKEIFIYLGMGLLVAVPWFARTVIISGWLVYPLPALDLFSFDWKMDAELIAIDAAQISAWGRALYNVALLDTPITVWLPNWFATTLSGTEKLLILGCAGCILVFLISVVWTVIRKKWQHLDFILLLGTVICSYLFWQVSAPLMRYGYAYVLLLVFLTAGRIMITIGKEKLIYFTILLYGLYKAFTIGQYISGTYLNDNYIWQQDYGTYELSTYEIDGVTFYKPVSGDQTGYEAFPAAPTQADIELRGDSLKDGFRKKSY